MAMSLSLSEGSLVVTGILCHLGIRRHGDTVTVLSQQSLTGELPPRPLPNSRALDLST